MGNTVGGPISVDSILFTEELGRRPSRQPDHDKENRALLLLTRTLADSPQTILQTLTETILELLQCGSAGVSLLTTHDGGKRFYWPAIAGVWKPHVGGGTPRDFGPCGTVLDRNSTLLFKRVERVFTYFEPVQPAVEEALLVPFYVNGKAVGTVWAVAHDDRRKFDTEDKRELESLAQFAAAAYQSVNSLDAAKYLAAIVESSDDAIVSKNLDGVISSWNGSAEKMFGYTAGEAIGQRITLIVPPDHRNEELTILDRLRRGERVDHFQTVRMRKDGTTLDVSLTISPVKDAAGHVIGASKVARDVTENKRRERALAEQARLLDLSTDAVFVRDSCDRVTYWNKGAYELYGYSSEEALGRVTHELLKTEFPSSLKSIYEQLHREDRWGGELIHIRKDGTHIVVSSRWVLDRQADGEPSSILETNSDITERKRLEEAIRESELSARLLQVQDEERRRIARELHDGVGQLLALLRMNSAAVEKEGTRLTPRVAQLVRDNTGLIQQISTDIRTVSYLLHPPLLDEIGLRSALTWFIEGFAERSKIVAKLEVPAALERMTQDYELCLFRIAQECLTNIHRHSGSPTALVRLWRTSSEINMEVKDEGRGLSKENQAKIASGESAGVGLRGMRERVKRLGGTFEVHSQAKGMTVLVTLPLINKVLSQGEKQHEASAV